MGGKTWHFLVELWRGSGAAVCAVLTIITAVRAVASDADVLRAILIVVSRGSVGGGRLGDGGGSHAGVRQGLRLAASFR